MTEEQADIVRTLRTAEALLDYLVQEAEQPKLSGLAHGLMGLRQYCTDLLETMPKESGASGEARESRPKIDPQLFRTVIFRDREGSEN